MPGTNSHSRSAVNSPRHGFTLEGTSPFIIGVAGGTASGKSSVCQKILDKISGEASSPVPHNKKVICLSLDQFYLDLSVTDTEKARRGQFNFDHPDAFDLELILSTMKKVKEGKSKVIAPCYDYINNQRRAGAGKEVEPAHVVFIEGILAFYWPELREMYDMKLFVDTDADTRLSRRVSRDVKERERCLDQILSQYVNTVKPAFEDFCLPTKKFADIIIPRGADNTVAIDLIAQSIRDLLATRHISGGGDAPASSNPAGLTKRNSSARLH